MSSQCARLFDELVQVEAADCILQSEGSSRFPWAKRLDVYMYAVLPKATSSATKKTKARKQTAS